MKFDDILLFSRKSVEKNSSFVKFCQEHWVLYMKTQAHVW